MSLINISCYIYSDYSIMFVFTSLSRELETKICMGGRGLFCCVEWLESPVVWMSMAGTCEAELMFNQGTWVPVLKYWNINISTPASINRFHPMVPIAWHLISPGLSHNPAVKGLSLAHVGFLFSRTCSVSAVQSYEHH